jgi:hypothetical protein
MNRLTTIGPEPDATAEVGQQPANGDHQSEPIVAAWPQTLLDRDQILTLVYDFPIRWKHPDVPRLRRNGAARLLDWLACWPGESWQARWDASGAEKMGRAWTEPAIDRVVATEATRREFVDRELRNGACMAICMRVLRPGYDWMTINHLSYTYRYVRRLVDPELFDEMDAAATE